MSIPASGRSESSSPSGQSLSERIKDAREPIEKIDEHEVSSDPEGDRKRADIASESDERCANDIDRRSSRGSSASELKSIKTVCSLVERAPSCPGAAELQEDESVQDAANHEEQLSNCQILSAGHLSERRQQEQANESQPELFEIDLDCNDPPDLRSQHSDSAAPSISPNKSICHHHPDGKHSRTPTDQQDDQHAAIIQTTTAPTMIHNQQASQSAASGFADVPPKLSFASKRMKEYFESFQAARERRHRHESTRLYQFFKSTRSELAACLLFSLIVCYALIICKLSYSNLTRQPQQVFLASVVENSRSRLPASLIMSTVQVHLVLGLVSALAVATLVQVFGHVSGCHLIPSVSLALYFKGHISRARLVSYLGAQALGSFLGVALLSLLTSSQMSTSSGGGGGGGSGSGGGGGAILSSHRQSALEGAGSLALAHFPSSLERTSFTPSGGLSSLSNTNKNSSRPELVENIERRRRSVNYENNSNQTFGLLPGSDAGGILSDNSTGEFGIASETILLSVMEQKERELGARLAQRRQRTESAPGSSLGTPANVQHQQPSANAEIKSSNSTDDETTKPKVNVESLSLPTTMTTRTNYTTRITTSSTTNAVNEQALVEAASSREEVKREPNEEFKSTIGEQQPSRASLIGGPLLEASSTLGPSQTDTNQRLRQPQQRLVMVPLQSDLTLVKTTTSSSNYYDSIGRHQQLDDIDVPPARKKDADQQQQLLDAVIAPTSTTTTRKPTSKKVSATRRRSRRQQVAIANSSSSQDSTRQQRQPGGESRVVNLLEFALPDEIMSSESIEKCMQLLNRTHKTTNDVSPCLTLSNGSQMFIFQLLATLLVNLTYLANVDPRRVDLGYKSLSIGLAYFLAHLLASQSGGFCGQPMQLVALFSFSSSSSYSSAGSSLSGATEGERLVWRSEWFIYLATPLIGGLFSALSHEYIDFTSARNMNKQLHLRRSFFSLVDLEAEGGARTESCRVPMRPLVHTNHQTNGRDQATAPSQRTRGSQHLNGPSESAPTRQSSASLGKNSSASSSDDGNGSSVATLHLTDSNNKSNQGQRVDSNGTYRPLKSSAATTCSSYSRQLKLERERIKQRSGCKEQKSKLRNQNNNNVMTGSSLLLDTNFLIGCSAGPRDLNNNQHQQQVALTNDPQRLGSHLSHYSSHHHQIHQNHWHPANGLARAQICTSQFM